MKVTRFDDGIRGAALIVSLILLVVITLLGLSSVRTVTLEERMTSNTFDRSLGFQATEAALRAGEMLAVAQSRTAPPNAGFIAGGVFASTACDALAQSPCQNGLCSQPDPACVTPRWLEAGFGGWTNVTGMALGPLALTPQFFVEYLGENFPCDLDNPFAGAQDCRRYRITARSHGGGDRAMVMLQSVYATR